MMNRPEKKSTFKILFFPILFFLAMWLVKLIEIQFNLSFSKFGVFPRTKSGIKGILCSPFIHAEDLKHICNNSIPILVLGAILFSSYKKIALEIFIWLFFISGFWLWIIGRPSFHIGASGIIYALASFLLISGFIRKDPRLAAVSFVIIFLYGSMIWHILPIFTIKETISWEAHLAGFLAGILVSIFYKNEGPKRKKYQWEIDEELEGKASNIKFHYTIKEEKEDHP